MLGLQLLVWISAMLAVQAFSPSMSVTLKPDAKATKAALLRVFGESTTTLRPQSDAAADQQLPDKVAYDQVHRLHSFWQSFPCNLTPALCHAHRLLRLCDCDCATAHEQVLASPLNLAPLRDGIRLYGSAGAVKFKEDAAGQLRFPVNSVYTDFFLGETKAPWELSREELVMEGTVCITARF
jgi:hypothetical protein